MDRCFREDYSFREIEEKWNVVLSSSKSGPFESSGKAKYYVLEMLPYPSGKLHMGHVRNYTIGDVVARFRRMLGFFVVHPMGWDSFGLPAENAALDSGMHPGSWTNANIADMRGQLRSLCYMYDWEREISTCDVSYYAQEQKMFLDMYRCGLAYQKESYVNWDPVEQTVLANEQVIDGKGWRSKAPVEKKLLKQWYLRITKYSRELLDGLKSLEGHWPASVLKMQENWIGRSTGALVHFSLVREFAGVGCIDVFTTRPDTIFGASFVAISPDHELALSLAENDSTVRAFLDECKKIKNTEEEFERAEKKGIDTGLLVVHPFDRDRRIPVYIANFVLIDYGSGAVFGCPAHDERDFAFAQRYGLDVLQVIDSKERLPYTGSGVVVNSKFLDGLDSEKAKEDVVKRLVLSHKGEARTVFRIRDWLVSRQRYWGCPIPIVHCPRCGVVHLDKKDLPVVLPREAEFNGQGNPLDSHPTWRFVECPRCRGAAVRDTDTLDTFFESSWYFMRYLDPNCEDPVNKDVCTKLLPVDLYVGGIEHAILHLLYARFFTMALRDMGYVSLTHPFRNLLTQGMVCHKSFQNSAGEWLYPDEVSFDKEKDCLVDTKGNIVTENSSEKMSKSKKNLVNPQKIIDSHGVDAVRLFILSDTPPEKDFDWNTDALDGAGRFLSKIWKTFVKVLAAPEDKAGVDILTKIAHIYSSKIKESFVAVSLNRSVAFVHEFFNEIEENLEVSSKASAMFAFETFVKVFSPIVPNITHEMYSLLYSGRVLQNEPWPEADDRYLETDEVTIAIQVNGKLRGTVTVAKDSDDQTLKECALRALRSSASPGLLSESIKRIVVVKNKIVSIVV
jgi:leucyl-tRNA synthetase